LLWIKRISWRKLHHNPRRVSIKLADSDILDCTANRLINWSLL
jgi:hypothetical protein